MPRKSRERPGYLYHAPVEETAQAAWNAHREMALLETRLANEENILRTWQRRLVDRQAWEQTHADPSILPKLRSECARVHTRVRELAHQLDQARVRVRTLTQESSQEK